MPQETEQEAQKGSDRHQSSKAQERISLSLCRVLGKHTATFSPCAEGEFRQNPSHGKRWNKHRPLIWKTNWVSLCLLLTQLLLLISIFPSTSPPKPCSLPVPEMRFFFPFSFSYKTPAKPDGVNYIRTDDEVTTNALHFHLWQERKRVGRGRGAGRAHRLCESGLPSSAGLGNRGKAEGRGLSHFLRNDEHLKLPEVTDARSYQRQLCSELSRGLTPLGWVSLD